jgi:hypothetical protein
MGKNYVINGRSSIRGLRSIIRASISNWRTCKHNNILLEVDEINGHIDDLDS